MSIHMGPFKCKLKCGNKRKVRTKHSDTPLKAIEARKSLPQRPELPAYQNLAFLDKPDGLPKNGQKKSNWKTAFLLSELKSKTIKQCKWGSDSWKTSFIFLLDTRFSGPF